MMSELPRRFVARLRRFIGNRRRHKRMLVRLTFTLGIADPRLNSNGLRRLPSLEGHTVDISTTGMGLIVPAIRIGEHYLTGDQRRLHLKVDLPGGAVEMLMIPVRYESLEVNQNDSGYLIGARIAEMSDLDRKHYDEFVKKLLVKETTD